MHENTMGEDLLDFNERCRLCIEPKRLSIDIFSEEGRRIKLESKIKRHLSLKVSECDGFSHRICYQCLFRLETWVSFKQLCVERDQVMKTWSQTFSKKVTDESGESQSSKPIVINTNNGKHTKPPPPKKKKSDVESCKVSKAPSKPKNVLRQALNAPIISAMWSVEKSALEEETSAKKLNVEKKSDEISPYNIENVDSNIHAVPNQSIGTLILPEEFYEDGNSHSRKMVRKSNRPACASSHFSEEIDFSSVEEMQIENTSNVPNVEEENVAVPEITYQTNGKLSLKRKRGRPSKAFLQLERQLKRLRGKARQFHKDAYTHSAVSPPLRVAPVIASVATSPSSACATSPSSALATSPTSACASSPTNTPGAHRIFERADAGTHTPHGAINFHYEYERDVCQSPVDQDFELPEESNLDLVSVVKEEDVPIEKEELASSVKESGVTEVVLNDPDFGSMKFTLSIVGMDSPVSSPPSIEDYKHCPETCELKEDFEGFESSEPSCPNSTDLLQHTTSEVLQYRSLTDVRLVNSEDSAQSSNAERSRSISASGDFVGDCNTSATSLSVGFSAPYISKSLENLHELTCSPKKRSYLILDDRSAHSDGEIMEK